jgi:aminoglycoside/choline kinase family phosphotransferase
MLPNDARLEQVTAWLASLPRQHRIDPATLAVASADASFRRYFRVVGGS